MNLNLEFVISLVVQIIILAFFCGIYVATIKFLGMQIKELKEQSKTDKEELKQEMRKYNDVLSRLAVAENSISSAHRRIDEHIREETL